MAISRDEVLHVARLARLALSEEELERFSEQLSAILDAVGKVAEPEKLDHAVGIGKGDSDWFFDQDLFAGLHSVNGDLGMKTTGYTNADRVNVVERE